MRNSILTILLIGLLLLLIASPFAALAPLMIALFMAAFGWMCWILVKTLIFGDPSQES